VKPENIPLVFFGKAEGQEELKKKSDIASPGIDLIS
jgi:hypothetical protein